MSESSLIVIVLQSLVYPYFKHDIEQDEIRQALLVKQETEWVEWFCSFLLIPSILEYVYQMPLLNIWIQTHA